MTGLTITFLGTGTSQGVPMIGCECTVCTSIDPRDFRTRASIYVETPECAFVVDTGPDFRLQALREKIHRMDAAIYTHGHTDHVMGFDDLRPFCANFRKLPIYASPATMQVIQNAFGFAFHNEHPSSPGYIIPEAHLVDGPIVLGSTTITPLDLPHGRTITTGYLFSRAGKKIAAYLSDCKSIPAEALQLLESTPVLILDALRHRSHPTHMNIEEALQVVKLLQPQQTWFTHLCHELPHAETESTLPPGVRIAYDGLKLHL